MILSSSCWASAGVAAPSVSATAAPIRRAENGIIGFPPGQCGAAFVSICRIVSFGRISAGNDAAVQKGICRLGAAEAIALSASLDDALELPAQQPGDAEEGDQQRDG